jgi:hypothetical protein
MMGATIKPASRAGADLAGQHCAPAWHREQSPGILATGAARSGRRTARPHARPAAPPLSHEDGRHGVAMSDETVGISTPWVSITVRLQDKQYTGLVPDDFDSSQAVGWGQAALAIGPDDLTRELAKKTRLEDVADALSLAPAVLDALRLGLTYQQARLCAWFLAGLSSGHLRACGRRAGDEASLDEWIPRTVWEGLQALPPEAARALFRGISAFRLRADEPAWCEVRIVKAQTPTAQAVKDEMRRIQAARQVGDETQQVPNVAETPATPPAPPEMAKPSGPKARHAPFNEPPASQRARVLDELCNVLSEEVKEAKGSGLRAGHWKKRAYELFPWLREKTEWREDLLILLRRIDPTISDPGTPSKSRRKSRI